MSEALKIVSASWNGDEGATYFTFSDGSDGVQHLVGSGLGLKYGPLHSLNPAQHRAVVTWFDRQNVGKGIL